MSNAENFGFIETARNNKNVAKLAAALAVGAMALSGCAGFGGGKKSSEDIPNCPSGYETTGVVHHQGNVITEFERAGQLLARDYKTASRGSRKTKLGIAYQQLFKQSSGTTGLFHNQTNPNGNQLTPDSYQSDDPAEIFCTTENKSGDEDVVLSPQAIESKAILNSVGIHVKFGREAVKSTL